MTAVAEKLREARALIERGWTQGVFARLPNGNGTYAENRKATCFCMVGALYHVGASARCLRMLERATHTSPAAKWNDAPERTQADVLAAFDKAIALAEGRV